MWILDGRGLVYEPRTAPMLTGRFDDGGTGISDRRPNCSPRGFPETLRPEPRGTL